MQPVLEEEAFVVNICNQRTGSKFLGSCLRAGAALIPLGELFNPDAGSALTFWSWLAGRGSRFFGNGISRHSLDEFFGEIYRQVGPFYFDLMYNQISAIAPSWHDQFGFFILRYLRERGANIIHTERSPEDIYVSLARLAKTGIPHVRADSTRIWAEDPKDEVNVSDMEHFKSNYLQWRDAVNRELSGYDRCFHLTFSHLISTNDFLPDDLISFISTACARIGPEYADFIQVRKTMYGRSPERSPAPRTSDLHP